MKNLIDSLKTSTLVLISLFFLNASCENKPIYEDKQLGLQVFAEAVSFENIAVLSNTNLKTEEATIYGDVITIQIMGASGFKEINGRVFVGGEITLYDDKEQVVKEIPDILKQYETTGVSPEDIKQISFKMSTGKPLIIGKKYLMVARLWNKSGKGEISSRLSLDIKPNSVN